MDFRTVKCSPYGEKRSLDFVGKAFKLPNHPNVTAINAIYGSDVVALRSFGTATNLAPPRQMRFSIDFEF